MYGAPYGYGGYYPPPPMTDPYGGYGQKGGGKKGGGDGGKSDGVCFNFSQGKCFRGDSCRFKHIGTPGATPGTKITAVETKETTEIPSDLVLDYWNVEEMGNGVKAIIWGTKPFMRALSERRTNADNKKFPVNAPIVACGKHSKKLQDLVLYMHNFSKDHAKTELEDETVDKMIAECTLVCKKYVSQAYTMPEANSDMQAMKEENSELKNMMEVLSKTAIETQKNFAKQQETITAIVTGQFQPQGGSVGAGSAFGPHYIATPQGGRRRKLTRVAKKSGSRSSVGSYASGGMAAPEPMWMRPDPGRLRAQFDDVGDDESESGESTDLIMNSPQRLRPVGGDVGGQMPAMPSMNEVSMQELLTDAIKTQQPIPNERLGWEFTDELQRKATDLLKGYQRANKKTHIPFLETDPVPEAFKWLLAMNPVKSPEEGGICRRITLDDLGRLATVFTPNDFREASVQMERVLDGVRKSETPHRRIAKILPCYGVELGGLPSFKLGLMVLSLSFVKDRREAQVAADTQRAARVPVPEGASSSNSRPIL